MILTIFLRFGGNPLVSTLKYSKMKTLKKEDNREEIAEIIQGMFLDLNPIVSWEVDSDGKRTIFPVKVSDVNIHEDFIAFKSTNSKELVFEGSNILFFSADQRVIFKADLDSKEAFSIKVKIPDIVKKLEESDNTQYAHMIETFNNEMQFGSSEAEDSGEGMDFITSPEEVRHNWFTESMSEHDSSLFQMELNHITMEEEDKMYEGVRSTPRAKPPDGKMVTVQPLDESRAQATYILYDLSQGGLSFLVFSKEDFNQNEKVIVKAFDIQRFEQPLEGVVKAIREADDLGIQYKVGIQFVDAH